MHKWSLTPSPKCECGASEQTADHVLLGGLIHRAPHGARGLTVWMTKPDTGLVTPLPASDSGSTAVWGSKRINPRPQSCLCQSWSGYSLNDVERRRRQLSKIDFSIITTLYCPCPQLLRYC